MPSILAVISSHDPMGHQMETKLLWTIGLNLLYLTPKRDRSEYGFWVQGIEDHHFTTLYKYTYLYYL